MGRLRIAGACVVVAMAVGATVAAADATATPAWYECAKASPKNTGDYSSSKCTTMSEPGKGKYVLQPGVGKKKPFKGKGKPKKNAPPSLTLNVVEPGAGDQKVECTGYTDTGTAALPNIEEKVSVDFTGCEAFQKKCTTAGAAEGEIQINGLKGELGYLDLSPVKVGLRLESETDPSYTDHLAVVTCPTTLEFTVVGGVIGEQTGDVNQLSKDSAVTYTAEGRIGVHKFGPYEYTPLVNLVGWAEQATEIEEEIEKDLNGELPKLERPIIKTIICGELAETFLHEHCTPEAYSGLAGTISNKGENLEVKA